MEKVKFRDFKVIPDINSVRREDMDDETYFSSKYTHYISNSRLKWIDPLDGGNPALFKNPPKLKTGSLLVGSRVHELILQPNDFELAPKLGKPNAKLGDTLDLIPGFLKEGVGLDDAIKNAAKKADYYASSIDTDTNKVEAIKKQWETFNKALEELNKTPTDKIRRVVSDKDWDVINACVNSCLSNQGIVDLLHPKTPFDDEIESHCEDTFFMDYIVTYKNKNCAILPFKMKADNWTIDYDSKILTLNDLKTTGKSCNIFMNPEGGSFYHYNYARQMAVYSQILWYWNMRYHGVTKETDWKLKANMLVVETIPNYWSRPYYVTDKQLKEGHKMLNELLCRVAYCEMFGYDKEIEFE